MGQTQGAPLKGRVDAMEGDVTSLKERLAKVQAEVGVGDSSGAAAPAEEPPAEATALVDTEVNFKHKKRSLALVDTTTMGDDLKSRVATLEADVAKLKSDTSTLENAVVGQTFGKASLLQLSAGSSLKARIVSLEDEIDILRSRMTTLEHTVEG